MSVHKNNNYSQQQKFCFAVNGIAPYVKQFPNFVEFKKTIFEKKEKGGLLIAAKIES